jgi:hypothetical protein
LKKYDPLCYEPKPCRRDASAYCSLTSLLGHYCVIPGFGRLCCKSCSLTMNMLPEWYDTILKLCNITPLTIMYSNTSLTADLSIEDFQYTQFFIHAQFLKPWYSVSWIHSLYLCKCGIKKTGGDYNHNATMLFRPYFVVDCNQNTPFCEMCCHFMSSVLFSQAYSSPPKNVIVENVP